MSHGAADVEPESMTPRAGFVGLSAVDEKPLTAELGRTGKGEVVQVEGFGFVPCLPASGALAGVVDEQGGCSRPETETRDGL